MPDKTATPTTLEETLRHDVPPRSRRFIDEPGLTIVAVIFTLPFAWTLFHNVACPTNTSWLASLCPSAVAGSPLEGNTLSSFSNTAAAGLVALCAIGITVVVMAMPLLLSTKFRLLDGNFETARSKLRGVVAVYWVNIRSMMLNASLATLFAMLGNVSFPWLWVDEIFSAVVPFFVVQGFGRCWILVREAMEVVLAAVNSINPPENTSPQARVGSTAPPAQGGAQNN